MTEPTPAAEVPLIEQLRSVPKSARYVFEETFSSRYFPVGRLCHDAADALEAQPATPPVLIDGLRATLAKEMAKWDGDEAWWYAEKVIEIFDAALSQSLPPAAL